MTEPTQGQQSARPPLTVWYGSMPESNGKANWTAILGRKGDPTFDLTADGFCFARSEYSDRVRYDADHMRWVIGELTEKPYILDYDEKAHSGYVAPAATPARAEAQDEGAAGEREEVDRLSKVYADATDYYVQFHRGLSSPSADKIRKGIRAVLAAHPSSTPDADSDRVRKFSLGDRVEKTKGSAWHGRVVGFYSTSLTQIGYAVESEREPGSVQIYPEAALKSTAAKEGVT